MNAEAPSSLEVVLFVIEVLEDLAVQYHIGGSFASAIHGVPRQTMDADLVVALDADRALALVQGLEDTFYVDPDVALDAVRRRGSFNAIHLASGFKIDFFVKGEADYDDIELERSVHVQISTDPPRSAAVKSAEDTVLRKLQWYRTGGEVSDRQWRDVLGVLVANRGGLDQEYLETWANRLQVEDLLRRAEREAGHI
jgi:hypothetical protein